MLPPFTNFSFRLQLQRPYKTSNSSKSSIGQQIRLNQNQHGYILLPPMLFINLLSYIFIVFLCYHLPHFFFLFLLNLGHSFKDHAEPQSSVCSVADLRTGGCWYNPLLSQYSFPGLMIVIATGFFPLSLLSIVSTMFMWESSQCLGKNIVQYIG